MNLISTRKARYQQTRTTPTIYHTFFMTQEIITAKPRLLAVANSIIASKLDEEVPSFPGPGDTRPDTSANASVALTEELWAG